MVMLERYGSPSTRLIDLLAAWSVPFRNVRAGDRLLILTDDAMDPLVWQSAMASIAERGAEVTLGLYPRLQYHNASPPQAALEAARGADAIVALTTTALNSGTPALRSIRGEGGGTGTTPIWLMEEITVEILTEGGGRATVEDLEQICAVQRRIGELYDKGKWIQVSSQKGTNLTADISDYPPGYHVQRREALPFSRSPKTDKLAGGTWPFGEVHVEPLPGTANGTVVWDTTAHHPPGLWREPVALTVKDGKVVDIEGGVEAEQVRDYLETYGDESSWLLGGEIAIGTNHRCWPAMGQMRNDKKSYGNMHLGIGHGSDRGIIMSSLRLEGIIARISVAVDDTVICDKGKIVI